MNIRKEIEEKVKSGDATEEYLEKYHKILDWDSILLRHNPKIYGKTYWELDWWNVPI